MESAYRFIFRFVRPAPAWLAALALCGCVTVTEKAPSPYRGNPTVVVNGRPEGPPQQPIQPPSGAGAGVGFDDVSRGDDPCGARMHDICGALLFYYASRKELPARLEDLQPFIVDGSPLRFSCPVSHAVYVYDPKGPSLSNSIALATETGPPMNNRGPVNLGQIIIYDASPAHNGQRWAILFGRDITGKTPTATPYLIPEKTFNDAMRASRASPK